MIEEQYVSFVTALMEKEQGFDKKVRYYFTPKGTHIYPNFLCLPTKYLHGVARPTQELLARWLREKYRIQISIIYNYHNFCYHVEIEQLVDVKSPIYNSGIYKSYEDAKETGLQSALALLNVSQNYDNTIYIGKLGV